MPRVQRTALLLIGLALLIEAEAGVVTNEVRREVQKAKPGETISVILRLRDKVDLSRFIDSNKKIRRKKIVLGLKDKAARTQQELRGWLRQNGAADMLQLWMNNSLAVTIPARLVQDIANRPEIELISLDARVQVQTSVEAASTPPNWNLSSIGADSLWSNGVTGQGVVVATMDTGVDPQHPDLSGKWRGGVNSWFDPWGEHNSPYDNNGHGTQVMGLILGGNASGQAVGVAPDARWIAVKIFNDLGSTTLSTIHQGFQWLLDPDGSPATDDAPHIVNNSWGLRNTVNGCNSEFQSDIAALQAADIAVVFSAGNGGPNPSTSLSPANYEQASSVGAVDESLTIASFSARGPSACDGGIYPKVVAPGVNVYTTDLTAGGVFLNSYTYVSGTSFSVAHATGGLALLKSGRPSSSTMQLEAAMRNSATDLGDAGADNDYGMGLINLSAAYDTLMATPTNNPPVAQNDTFNVDEDTVLNVSTSGVLGNDSDAEGDALAATVVNPPSHGALTFNTNGAFSYTPNANYNGPDSFTYQANDGMGNSNTATVNITVNPVNDPPVANAQSTSTNEDTAQPITLAGSDVDGDPLTYTIVTGPTHGTASSAGPIVTYTPNTNYFGQDSFIFKVNDGTMDSAPAAAFITIIRKPPPTIYVSLEASIGTVGGIAWRDEDILANIDGVWSMYFDGSDVGLGGTDIDAFHKMTDGSLLLSTRGAVTLPVSADCGANPRPSAVSTFIDDSDIVRFVPTSLGDATAGCYEWYFDGSDVGLTTDAEDVDAIAFDANGNLVVSTDGNPAVPGLSGLADEDLIVFTGALGRATRGAWAMYFDGSDVALSQSSGEDINDADRGTNGVIYLTTVGAFTVPGATGDGSDILACGSPTTGPNTSCTYSIFWDGSNNGLTGQDVDALDIE
jgi:VCBS repeat-containing protein